MGQVDAFTVSGCKCFFNTSDHNPPHFHVKSNDGRWEIRAYILITSKDELKYDFKFPSSRKEPIPGAKDKEIRNLIVKFRESLLKEWEEKVIKDQK